MRNVVGTLLPDLDPTPEARTELQALETVLSDLAPDAAAAGFAAGVSFLLHWLERHTFDRRFDARHEDAARWRERLEPWLILS